MSLPKFLGSISTSDGGMYLKLHIWHSTHVRYKEY